MRISFAILALAALIGTKAAAAEVKPAESFRDCENCPEMVPIPKGSFMMGAAEGQPNISRKQLPQHRVTIGYSLAVGKFDVTREEYSLFVEATNRPDPLTCETMNAAAERINTPNAGWRNPGFSQGANDPAVCVSWDDAVAYAQWLSQKTGKHYRLPSESEWEYFARAGTTGTRYGSEKNADLCDYINHGDRDYFTHFPGDPDVNRACGDGYVFTSPVGSFPSNPWGLYDVLGNVWQWTADCDNPNYEGAPADGSAWTTGNCDVRVGRGGAWTEDANGVRAVMRGQGVTYDHGSNIGFRVVREM